MKGKSLPKEPRRTKNTTESQRAQRSKKNDLDRIFQSRSKCLISLEIFNLDVSISPQKIGPRWVARSKISFSIEIFNLDRNLDFFLIFGPSGIVNKNSQPEPRPQRFARFRCTRKPSRAVSHRTPKIIL